MHKPSPSYLRGPLFWAVFQSCILMAVQAEEGMWLISDLDEQRILKMQAMGWELGAGDIYRTDSICLIDAVVHFGGFCTAEVISAEGLLITNHHCGLSRIQSHTTVENNYIEEGFWAGSKEEELPNPGLWVRFLRSVENVTDSVLVVVGADMNESERLRAVRRRIRLIEAMAQEETGRVAQVKSFDHGAAYYLFLYEEFRDIRLVGAPPISIGKFGGDTDNWEWPRHTGDFSLFRIYADSNNAPADYSPDNIPYRPRYHFPVSVEGVDENDFTLVIGYPGTTNQYLLADDLEMIVEERLPEFVRIRSERLEVMRREMARDETVAIQYASKYSSTANYWKKNQGIIRGIRLNGGLAQKRHQELQFRRWAGDNRKVEYLAALDSLEELLRRERQILLPSLYQNEIARSVELLDFAAEFRELLQTASNAEADPEYLETLLAEARAEARSFFRDYSVDIDRQVFVRLMRIYAELPSRYIPASLSGPLQDKPGRLDQYARQIFTKSFFADSGKLYAMLEVFPPKTVRRLKKDKAFGLMMEFEAIAEQIEAEYRDIVIPANRYYRLYVKGLKEMYPERSFYPDANGTLRFSYGRVEDYVPRDGVQYGFRTTLEGIIEKSHHLTDDYRIPDRLRKLHEENNDPMPVCFIASNHTTNGNSGSPVLNASGQLVGLNFDRNWEGTMSDYIYDIQQCRNITLDMRYVLFIIDRYAGAGHLIDEMQLIQ